MAIIIPEFHYFIRFMDHSNSRTDRPDVMYDYFPKVVYEEIISFLIFLQ